MVGFRGGLGVLLVAPMCALACGGESTSTPLPEPTTVDPVLRTLSFDYQGDCQGFDSMYLTEATSLSGYGAQLVQRRTTPDSVTACIEAGGQDCWKLYEDCNALERQPLDSSQWPEESTVLVVHGLEPGRVNPLRSALQSDPFTEVVGGEKVEAHIGYVSYYETRPQQPPESPPGCIPSDYCGYYWYLDAFEDGVAVVLCPAFAIAAHDVLDKIELRLCVSQ